MIAALVFIACLDGGVAHAAFIGFTSRSAYDAAVAAFTNQQTQDFEALGSGTLIPNGSSVGGSGSGIRFDYPASVPTLRVTNAFGTTSMPSSLGVDSADEAFRGGDVFVMTIDHTVNAFALYVLAEDLFPGDITLVNNNGSAFSNAAADTTLSDGQAFFVGFVDTAGFSTVTLSSFQENYVFNVDDIRTGVFAEPSAAVPEPATLALCASVAVGLVAWRRRR